LIYSLKALNMYERLSLVASKEIADCLRHVGMAYIRCNYYDYGLTFELKALQLYDRLGLGPNNKDMAICLKFITYGYFFTKDTANELKYALWALDVTEKLNAGDNKHTADCLKRVQIAYLRANDTSEGLSYGLRALAMYERLRLENQDVYQCSRNTAFAYSKCNDAANAALHSKKAEALFLKFLKA
jgi:hypothetical protein